MNYATMYNALFIENNFIGYTDYKNYLVSAICSNPKLITKLYKVKQWFMLKIRCYKLMYWAICMCPWGLCTAPEVSMAWIVLDSAVPYLSLARNQLQAKVSKAAGEGTQGPPSECPLWPVVSLSSLELLLNLLFENSLDLIFWAKQHWASAH